MTLEELKQKEAEAQQAYDEAKNIAMKKKVALCMVKAEIVEAYREKYKDLVGKRIIVTTKYTSCGNDREKKTEGYFRTVNYREYHGYHFVMSKMKKNGDESLNCYTYYDSPEIERITSIELYNNNDKD